MHAAALRSPGAWALLFCTFAGQAQGAEAAVAAAGHPAGDWRFGAAAHAEFMLYRDDAQGGGERLLEESVGVHNVHGAGSHAHGRASQGLNLRQVEAHFSADWQDRWRLGLGLMAAPRGVTAIEQAWVESGEGELPGGLGVRAGKFPARLGLSNALHPHERALATAPLAQTLLMGGGATVQGLELQWTPEWAPLAASAWVPRFSLAWSRANNAGFANRIGPVSVLLPSQGRAQTIAFDGARHRVGYRTAQVSVSPHLAAHRFELGLWQLRSARHGELHEPHPGVNNAVHGMQGPARVSGAFSAWRTATAVGAWEVQAEYWEQRKRLTLNFHELQPHLAGQPRELKENAYSVLVSLAPEGPWSFFASTERVGNIHQASRASATVGPTHTSYFESVGRHSLAASWRPRAEHQVTLQVSDSRIPDASAGVLGIAKVTQLMLRYVWSLQAGGPPHRH